MIYLGAELQKKLIPLFHFALRPNGFLFLGSSEGINDYNDLFSTLDRKAKLYQRQAGEAKRQNSFRGRVLAPLTTIDTFMPKNSEKVAGPVKRPLRELVEQTLLHHLGVSAALVKANGDILYLHGRTGLYLEPSSGEAGINNILKMARAGLSMTLPYHCNGSWRLGRSCTPRECRSKPTANLLKWSSVSAPSFLRR